MMMEMIQMETVAQVNALYKAIGRALGAAKLVLMFAYSMIL